mgnify:CR=1 FL=1
MTELIPEIFAACSATDDDSDPATNIDTSPPISDAAVTVLRAVSYTHLTLPTR